MKVRAIRLRAKRWAAGWVRIKAECGPFLHFDSMTDAIEHLTEERG